MIPPLSRRALLTAASRSVVPASAAALASLPQPAQAADTKLSELPLGTLPDYIYGIKGGVPNRFRPPYPIYNVKNFGAAGNGSRDDTNEIQTAMTTAGNNGGTLYFPSGLYRISKTLVASSQLSIIGEFVNGPRFGIGSVIQGNISRVGSDLTTGYLFVCVQSGSPPAGSYPRGSGSRTYPAGALGFMRNIFWYNTSPTGSCCLINSDQRALIERCRFNANGKHGCNVIGPPTGIEPTLPTGGLITFRNCIFTGNNQPGSVGLQLSTGAAIDCDATSFQYGFELIGAAPNLFSCRTETCDIGISLGTETVWGTISRQCSGSAVVGHQFEACNWQYQLYQAANCVIGPSTSTNQFSAPGFGGGYPALPHGGMTIFNADSCFIVGNNFAGGAAPMGLDVASVRITGSYRNLVFIHNNIGPGGGPGVGWIVPALAPNQPFGDGVVVWPSDRQWPNATFRQRTFKQLPDHINYPRGVGDRYIITDAPNADGSITAGGQNPTFGQVLDPKLYGGGGPHIAEVRWNGTVWTVCGL